MSNGITHPPSLAHIPPVEFAEKDPRVIEAQVIGDYEDAFESLTNIAKTLAPGDPVRLLLLTVCQLLTQLRVNIDFAAKENLLPYSHEEYLDGVASLYGPRADRLPAAPAVTVFMFTLTAPQLVTVIIPIGTQVTGATNLIFATTRIATIPAGQLIAVNVPAVCTTPGVAGNGYAPGQFTTLVGWTQPYGMNVTNTEVTAYGSDVEPDENYRYRTWLTPESFSTCGPRQAYEYWSLQAHPDIIQCVVHSAPEIAGEVHLYPLMRGGVIPGDLILALVLRNCDAEIRRPVSDYVTAYKAVEVTYNVTVEWYARRDDEVVIGQIGPKVNDAVTGWIAWQREYIGRDINPNELIRRVLEAGAKRVDNTSLQPLFRVALYNELATQFGPIIINFMGFEEE